MSLNKVTQYFEPNLLLNFRQLRFNTETVIKIQNKKGSEGLAFRVSNFQRSVGLAALILKKSQSHHAKRSAKADLIFVLMPIRAKASFRPISEILRKLININTFWD